MDASLMDLLKAYGLPTTMVVYFMWRDYQRDKRRDQKEDAVAAQFQELNNKQFELTKSCVEAVTSGNELKRDLKNYLENLLEKDGKNEKHHA